MLLPDSLLASTTLACEANRGRALLLWSSDDRHVSTSFELFPESDLELMQRLRM